jgi:hypothetical protein
MTKKITFLITAALMLLTMIVSPGRAVGQTRDNASFTPDDFSGQGTSGTGGAISATVSTVTFACDKGYGTTQIRCYSGGKITISSSNTITAISFTFAGSYTGGLSTSYTGLSTTSWEQTLSSQARINAVTVTYTAGGSSLTDNDIALTGAPIALEFDLYDNDDDQVINYTTSSTGLVSIANNEYIDTEINQNNKTITVIPKKVTPTAQTITVSQAADATYAAGSVTFTVSIEDSTPFSGGDITFVAGTDQGTSTGQNPDQITKSVVTVSSTSAALAVAQYRFYKNSTTTISTTSGNITQIVFTHCDNTYPISNLSNIDANGTWTGSATSVEFVASAQARASQIVVTVDTGSTPSPSITANNVNIAYTATNGSIAYTVNNLVSGGALTATTTAEWLTLGTVGETVPFTCSANELHESRTATVTLTYTYGTKSTVTKDVTITQAAAPIVYTSIPALFAAATTTETNVLVTFNNWVVSGVSTNGKNIFVTDNNGNGFVIYYNSDMSSTYAVGNILTGTAVSCSLKKYNGFAELLNVGANDLTITTGGTVTTANVAMADLAGVNTGALLHYENLTCSISSNKYYLSDGNTTLQLYNALFAFDALTDGKTYNITGVYQQYNSTKEILPRSADDIELVTGDTPVINASNVEIDYDATSGEIAYTITNPASGVNLGATTSAEWVSNIAVAADKVTFTTTANEGTEDRTATFTLTYTGAEDKVVTVTQGHYVVDYATLPFEWDGSGDTPTGITNSGVGTYSSSPYLKFDGSGDYIILKINERPGTLTFDIKGNTFSGGTFKVQTSANGTDYTDLETYTNLTNTVQSEEFTNLGEDVRYIKWIYTEKSSGNVALGNITLAQYVAPTASITVDPATVNATNTATEDYLGIAYTALTITKPNDFGIQFYDSNNQELNDDDEPDWITAEAATQIGQEGYFVYYIISANTGAARTAYFKVYALGDTDYVYSNLVTITQAAAPAPTYTIEQYSTPATAHGTITFNPASPVEANTEVTLTATPASGYSFVADSWVFYKESEQDYVVDESIVVLDNKITMPAYNLWVDATFEETNTLTFDFHFSVMGDDGWSTTYEEHIVEYTQATVTFESANKNSSTITDIPVTKGKSVSIVMKEGQPNMSGVTFVCRQWGTKTQTITLHYSTNGGTSYTSTGITSDNFTINCAALPAGANAVKITFSSSDNQVGIESATLNFSTDPVIAATPATLTGFVYAEGNGPSESQNITVSGNYLTNDITVALPTESSFEMKLGAGEWTNSLTLTQTDGSVASTTINVRMKSDLSAGNYNNTISVTSGELSESVTLSGTVNAAPSSNTYNLVTSLTPGLHYIIVSSNTNDEYFAMGGQNQNGDYRDPININVSENSTTISSDSGVTEVVISGNEGHYTLHTTEGFLKGGNKKLKNDGTVNDTWSITINNSGVATISYGDYSIKYNSSAPRFTCYASGQCDIYLYKKVGDTNPVYYSPTEITMNDPDPTSEPIIVVNNEILILTGDLSHCDNPDMFIIQDGGQVINTNDNPVSATLQKNITAASSWKDDVDGWYFIASPVDNLSTSAVTGSGLGTYDLFAYDEPNAYWRSNTGTGAPFTELERGKGYLYANKDDVILNFAGMMVSTNESISLPLSYACEYTDVKGYNLMGNPFTRNLTTGDITKGGVALTTYYGINAATTGMEAKLIANEPIKPGQGFFVQVESTDENHILVFNPSKKDETVDNGYICIAAGNENNMDKAYVQIKNGNTLRKMNIANMMEVYVMNDGDDYAAARVEELAGTMPVHFKAVEDGEFTITINAKNIEASTMMLFDDFTGEQIDLLETPSYTFFANESDDAARFTLMFDFNDYTGINESYVNGNFAYQNGDELLVSGDGTLQVFDVMGRFVMSKEIHGNESISVSAFETGVYMLRFVGENNMTQKIVVR